VDERFLVGQLKERLAPRYSCVLSHQDLTHLTVFTGALKERLGFLPVLNEIDLILVGKAGHLSAVEVKCFELKRNSGFTRPFYDGIGQALSLLRYGFDHVALWHLFSSDIDQSRFDRYGAATWWFIRNQLTLPLDFSYFKVEDSLGTPRFVVMQYGGPTSSVQLTPIDSPEFLVTWKYTNPLAQTEEAQCLRAALVKALGIGDSALAETSRTSLHGHVPGPS
jgi:hypothetical protein